MLSAAAAALWLGQAALVALGMSQLLGAGPGPGPLTTAAGFLALGILRAALAYRAEGMLFAAALRCVGTERARIVSAEARASASSSFGGPGAVAALAGEKLEMLVPYVSRYTPAQARTRLVPLLILALAFWHSWAVGVVFLVSGPLIPVFMALVGLAAAEASRRQMTEIGSLNDLLIDRLAALSDIRVLGARGRVVAGFADAAEGLRGKTMAVLRVAFLSSTVLELFAAIGVAMVAVWVGFALLGALSWGTWGAPLTPAAGIFLLLLAPDFYQPLRDLSAAWHDKAAALAVAAELEAHEAALAAPMLGLGGQAPRLQGAAGITLQGLVARGITYPDLTIAPGESLAVMGASGAGKTTLLRLLAGLERPDAGQITVAGQPLDDAHADGWRAGLGWMPQAPHFLNASLARNVTLGRTGDYAQALETAAIGPVIRAMPQGDRTRLGETGGGLSGGEARRLTLARASYGGPDLILADEPTADLDAATAEAVTEGLLSMAARGVTLVVATHDADLAARLGRTIVVGAA